MESSAEKVTENPAASTESACESSPTVRISPEASDEAQAAATVEAIVFASDAPLTTAKISSVAELPGRVVKKSIEMLNQRYEQAGTAFRIDRIADGYQMLTLPEYHDVLSRLLRRRSESRLSQAAMETLAIVAYRQPILRADIEAIRGVACGEVLRGLMEKALIKIVGRAEILGRPMLYGTTRRFLETFGLANLDDLPRIEELRAGAPEADRSPSAQNRSTPPDKSDPQIKASAPPEPPNTQTPQANQLSDLSETPPEQPPPPGDPDK